MQTSSSDRPFPRPEFSPSPVRSLSRIGIRSFTRQTRSDGGFHPWHVSSAGRSRSSSPVLGSRASCPARPRWYVCMSGLRSGPIPGVGGCCCCCCAAGRGGRSGGSASPSSGQRIGVKEGTDALAGIAGSSDPANGCGGAGTHLSGPAASAAAGCCPSRGRGGRGGGGGATTGGNAGPAALRWSLGFLLATTSTVAQLIFPAALCFIPWCAHRAILVRFVLLHWGHLYRVILSLRASLGVDDPPSSSGRAAAAEDPPAPRPAAAPPGRMNVGRPRPWRRR
mmetsp:Transcript_14650/g.33063  ORF Transcript_14650/g.33063 Transcript_14650/m.33063 type:complete len:280 (+) Transcript_14650:1187-2026(+)